MGRVISRSGLIHWQMALDWCIEMRWLIDGVTVITSSSAARALLAARCLGRCFSASCSARGIVETSVKPKKNTKSYLVEQTNEPQAKKNEERPANGRNVL